MTDSDTGEMTALESSETVDLAVIDRLLTLLFAEQDMFFFCSYTEKPYGPKNPKRFTSRMWYANDEGRAEVLQWAKQANEDMKRAVAVTIGAFRPKKEGNGSIESKGEEYISALQAFAIDIDEDDFTTLVPGAVTVEEVVPEVKRRLMSVGLKPHLIACSGFGIHVYVLCERIEFSTNDERNRAKSIWFKLSKLLDAPDRHDLASIMRLPGTLNRKNGGSRRSYILEDHSADLPRYTQSALEARLDALPALPEHQHVGHKSRAQKAVQSKGVDRLPRKRTDVEAIDPREGEVLEALCTFDTKLAALRESSRTGAGTDRSKVDFHYGCELFERGFSEDLVRRELGQSQKAVTREEYALVTFEAVAKNIKETRSLGGACLWRFWNSSLEASYRSKEDRLTHLLKPPAGVEVCLPPPIRDIVRGVPGAGKTRGLRHWHGNNLSTDHPRIGMISKFVHELLLTEYALLTEYEWGSPTAEGFIDRDPPPWPEQPPSTIDEVYPYLPAEVRQRWSLAKLKSRVGDAGAAAFFINCIHPKELDERIRFIMETGEDPRECVALEKVFHPFAVMKFRAREDLCSAGHDARKLKDRETCSTCPYLNCRANTATARDDLHSEDDRPQRGAKTMWRGAPVGLLTTKALEAHLLFKPMEVNFDYLISDELPELVFRTPTITIKYEPRVLNGKWKVDIVDALDKRLAMLAEEGPAGSRAERTQRVKEITTLLKRRASKLTNTAKGLRDDVLRGNRKPIEHKVNRCDPLLTSKEFDELVSCTIGFAPSLEEYQTDGDQGPGDELFRLLWRLRDFSGNGPIHVIMEHNFNSKGVGDLTICRPVNGWADLLRRSDGRDRDVLILDATAGIDPRYLLLGEQFAIEWYSDEKEYPQTTVVLTHDPKGRASRTLAKSKVKRKDLDDRASEIIGAAESKLASLKELLGRPARLLVLTGKGFASQLRQSLDEHMAEHSLDADVAVDHYGNLRGKNIYRDFDAVYFEYAHRYDGFFYEGLQCLLTDFKGFPGRWEHKSESPVGAWNYDHIRRRAMVADIYQDALRIGLRSKEPRPTVLFIPTTDPYMVGRLMRAFRGASFEHADGRKLLVPEPAPDAGGELAAGQPEPVDVAGPGEEPREARAERAASNNMDTTREVPPREGTHEHLEYEVDDLIKDRVHFVRQGAHAVRTLLRDVIIECTPAQRAPYADEAATTFLRHISDARVDSALESATLSGGPSVVYGAARILIDEYITDLATRTRMKAVLGGSGCPTLDTTTRRDGPRAA